MTGSYFPAPPKDTNNALGTAALSTGILSVLVCWFPWVGLPASILGIALGVLGKRKDAQPGYATVGLALGIVGAALLLVFGIVRSVMMARLGGLGL